MIQQKVTTAYNYLQQIVNDLNDNELSTTPLNADMMQPIKIKEINRIEKSLELYTKKFKKVQEFMSNYLEKEFKNE